ncbi:MAG: isoprenylcysteine carboxylmethyltransferase family protein [Bacteroidetes bacterium]|nr:isoprenylcysteine carboxylmethyltransferase family protein [Bacteroidota bacterium]
MNILFTAVYIIWITSEILINRLHKSHSADAQNLDKHTMTLIWITIGVVTPLSVYLASHVEAPIWRNGIINFIGLAVILAGCFFRFLAIRSLGKEFTVDVAIHSEHTLKNNGMYRIIRHPSYAFSLLSFIGFGLSLNNIFSTALLTLAVLAAFLRRIQVEEEALINKFGRQYLEYKKRTTKLIPYLW